MSDEKTPTHLDIFSGIGGFAIAAQEAGFQTIAFCEADERCRSFLEKTWGIHVEPDVRKLDGSRYAGVSLLTGGPPCQPASRAGNRRGAEDDRWLWPEALRILDEAQPDSFVFENPLGVGDLAEFGLLPPVDGRGVAIGDIGDTFDHDGCGVLDKIMGDIEARGYEAQVFDIPACAVDSPQLRHRYWIVGFLGDAARGRLGVNRSASGSGGHVDESGEALADAARHGEGRIREAAGTDSKRVGKPCKSDDGSMANSGRERRREDKQGRRSDSGTIDRRIGEGELADATGTRSDREERKEQYIQRRAPSNARPRYSGGDEGRDTEAERREIPRSLGSLDGLYWRNSVWVPCSDGKLRRAPDDSFELVNGLHRSVLGALGNAICWPLAAEILKAVRKEIR